ncbi:hypothetical protein BC835DRAFT_1419462 [Cytidiella melzeri]|nr:hypothetical protein BC835DRAFT_1419462 [Cytidiella melzeri]
MKISTFLTLFVAVATGTFYMATVSAAPPSRDDGSDTNLLASTDTAVSSSSHGSQKMLPDTSSRPNQAVPLQGPIGIPISSELQGAADNDARVKELLAWNPNVGTTEKNIKIMYDLADVIHPNAGWGQLRSEIERVFQSKATILYHRLNYMRG